MKNSYFLKRKPLQALAALAAAFPMLAMGQTFPGAGTILQQIQPVQPVQPPSAAPAAATLTIDQSPGAAMPSSAPFSVKQLRILGNTLFDTETLHALVAQAEGQTMPLDRLEALVADIAAYYNSQGYPLVRVVIPVQVIRDGIVRVQVIEGRYGKISLNNSSQVKDGLLQAALAPLQGKQPVSQTTLNRVLLLLSDVPGVLVTGVLKPGEALGATDLLVNTIQSGPSVLGNVTLDNSGNRYTGEARIAGTVFVVNPLHHGDVLSMSLLSAGSNMNYGRLAYDTLIDGKGTHLGGSLSMLDYTLGQPLEALKAHGTAQVASLWAKQPLMRSRDVNLYGKVQLDHLQLRDRIDARVIRTDRHLNNLQASLDGDIRDNSLVGAITTWNLGANVGRVGFDDAMAQSNDAQTARTDGRYVKWTASVARLQGLSAKNTLYFSLAGQRAAGNLDPSQKISAGGPYTVRAYEPGAVSGDSGYTGTAEWRHDLFSSGNDRWQSVVFIDGAYVKINQNPWIGTTAANTVTLRGAGVGLNWTGAQQWSAQLHIAAPFGAHPASVAGEASCRASAEISRRF
jgi:hemolysin activation/secretion protein